MARCHCRHHHGAPQQDPQHAPSTRKPHSGVACARGEREADAPCGGPGRLAIASGLKVLRLGAAQRRVRPVGSTQHTHIQARSKLLGIGFLQARLAVMARAMDGTAGSYFCMGTTLVPEVLEVLCVDCT